MRRQCSRCIRLRLIARHERVLTNPPMADNPREWSERSAELSRLLGRTGLGDRTAFAALYQHTSSHLFAVILRINRDRAQAEDLLQEVYVNVWRAAQASMPRRASRSPGSPASRATAPSTACAAGRPSRRSSPRAPSPAPLKRRTTTCTSTLADSTAEPLALLTQAAEARALDTCMQGLSALQRQCVALAFFHGLSHAEVAAQLRQPLGSVKSWVRRALLALKSCLQHAVQRDAEAS